MQHHIKVSAPPCSSTSKFQLLHAAPHQICLDNFAIHGPQFSYPNLTESHLNLEKKYAPHLHVSYTRFHWADEYKLFFVTQVKLFGCVHVPWAGQLISWTYRRNWTNQMDVQAFRFLMFWMTQSKSIQVGFVYPVSHLARNGVLNFFRKVIKAREPRSGHDVTKAM